MARPKKQTTETKPKKEKKIVAKEIIAPATTYIGELPNSDNEKDSIDNLTLATKQLDVDPKKDIDPIFAKYQEMCSTESDINLLLPKIYEIASLVEHCTEFGVRRAVSTWAFLAAKPKMLISYDIGRYDEEINEVEQFCKNAEQDFQFIQKSVLEVEIDETDFLWIDTFHSYSQLKKELQLHAHKVRHFIGAHDWETYKHVGETWYPGVADFMSCNEGIYRAVMEFLDENKEWSIFYETTINNGMIILKKSE